MLGTRIWQFLKTYCQLLHQSKHHWSLKHVPGALIIPSVEAAREGEAPLRRTFVLDNWPYCLAWPSALLLKAVSLVGYQPIYSYCIYNLLWTCRIHRIQDRDFVWNERWWSSLVLLRPHRTELTWREWATITTMALGCSKTVFLQHRTLFTQPNLHYRALPS